MFIFLLLLNLDKISNKIITLRYFHSYLLYLASLSFKRNIILLLQEKTITLFSTLTDDCVIVISFYDCFQ